MADKGILGICSDFCSAISVEARNVISAVQGGEFPLSDVFDAPICLSGIEDRKPLWGKKGVYVFLMKEDVSLTHEQARSWNEKCSGAGFRSWQAKELKKDTCLYLGSFVRQSLYTRIGHHFAEGGEATGLKLNHPARKILCDKVRVIAFPLKKPAEMYCRLIAPQI